MAPAVPVVDNNEGREAVETVAEEGEPTATAVTADGITGGEGMMCQNMYCKKYENGGSGCSSRSELVM